MLLRVPRPESRVCDRLPMIRIRILLLSAFVKLFRPFVTVAILLYGRKLRLKDLDSNIRHKLYSMFYSCLNVVPNKPSSSLFWVHCYAGIAVSYPEALKAAQDIKVSKPLDTEYKKFLTNYLLKRIEKLNGQNTNRGDGCTRV